MLFDILYQIVCHFNTFKEHTRTPQAQCTESNFIRRYVRSFDLISDC